MFSFALQAQDEKFDWDHVIGGAVVSNVFYWPAYAASNDENFSFRLACMFGIGAAVAKESFDVLVVPNGEFSVIDAGKSTIAVIGTAYLNRQLCKWVKKRIYKRKRRTIQDELIAEDPEFALENEIFVK